MNTLKSVILVHESRERWIRDRTMKGWSEEDAKVASFWLFADEDVLVLADSIRQAAPQLDIQIFEIDEIDLFLNGLPSKEANSYIVWNISDGVKRFRGSLVSALARLLGIPYFGSPVMAQGIAQDKFKLGAIARTIGVPVPRCALVRGRRVISSTETLFDAPSYFVKANSYGNKVGLSSDAITTTFDEALERAKLIGVRYGDDAVVQEYLPGPELRVTYVRGMHGLRFSLCHVNFSDDSGRPLPYYQITPTGYLGDDRFSPIETAGVFDTKQVRSLYSKIGQSVERLTSALELRDYWAMDFRLDGDGCPVLIDLNTGAFTKGEAFSSHSELVHEASLGQALYQALVLSHSDSLQQPPEQ